MNASGSVVCGPGGDVVVSGGEAARAFSGSWKCMMFTFSSRDSQFW